MRTRTAAFVIAIVVLIAVLFLSIEREEVPTGPVDASTPTDAVVVSLPATDADVVRVAKASEGERPTDSDEKPRLRVVDVESRPFPVRARLRLDERRYVRFVGEPGNVLVAAEDVPAGDYEIELDSLRSGDTRVIRAELSPGAEVVLTFVEDLRNINVEVIDTSGVPIREELSVTVFYAPMHSRVLHESRLLVNDTKSGAVDRFSQAIPYGGPRTVRRVGPRFDLELPVRGAGTIEVETVDGRVGQLALANIKAPNVTVVVTKARSGSFQVTVDGRPAPRGARVRMFNYCSMSRDSWVGETDEFGVLQLDKMPDELILPVFTLHLPPAAKGGKAVPDGVLFPSDAAGASHQVLAQSLAGGGRLDFSATAVRAWRLEPESARDALAGCPVAVWPMVSYVKDAHVPTFAAGEAVLDATGHVSLPAWIANGATEITLGGAKSGVQFRVDGPNSALVLQAVQTVSIDVVDDADTPVAGATVRWSGRSEGTSMRAFRRTSTVTKESGECELVVASTGGWLAVDAEGFASRTLEVAATESDARVPIRVELTPTSTAKLRVTTGDEAGGVGTVTYRPLRGGRAALVSFKLGEVCELPLYDGPGVYQVGVWIESRRVALTAFRLELRSGETVHFDVRRLREVELGLRASTHVASGVRARWSGRGGVDVVSWSPIRNGTATLFVPADGTTVNISATPNAVMAREGSLGLFSASTLVDWTGPAHEVPPVLDLEYSEQTLSLVAGETEADVTVWRGGIAVAKALVPGRTEDQGLTLPPGPGAWTLEVGRAVPWHGDEPPVRVLLSDLLTAKSVVVPDEVREQLAELGAVESAFVSATVGPVEWSERIELGGEPVLWGANGTLVGARIGPAAGEGLRVILEFGERSATLSLVNSERQ